MLPRYHNTNLDNSFHPKADKAYNAGEIPKVEGYLWKLLALSEREKSMHLVGLLCALMKSHLLSEGGRHSPDLTLRDTLGKLFFSLGTWCHIISWTCHVERG